MRRVAFKVFIPEKRLELPPDKNLPFGPDYTVVDGTGCWSEDYAEIGFFHQWATEGVDFGGEVALPVTVGIIEMNDGTIVTVPPDKVKFLV